MLADKTDTEHATRRTSKTRGSASAEACLQMPHMHCDHAQAHLQPVFAVAHVLEASTCFLLLLRNLLY